VLLGEERTRRDNRIVTPSIRRRSLSLWVAICCLGVARSAAGQGPADAEALFREGLEAMRAGNYEQACPKLRESYRLDPLPGALFTLAECEAAAGKSATAIELYQSFINGLTSLPPNRRDQFEERRRLALDKITALTALAPDITVEVAPSAPRDLVVKRNDVLIDPHSYGVGKKVDQGSYVVSAELDGKQVWKRRVDLLERDRATIVVPWPLPSEAAATASPPPKANAPADAPEAEAAAATRTWMYIAGGVGVAGLTTGVVAGIVALSNKGTIEDNCPERLCNAEGRDAVDTGQSAALVSSIGFAVGLAGAGATVALFLLSRSDAHQDRASSSGLQPTMMASQRGAAIGVRGSFR
jgi:hypothetical protein